MRKKSLRKNQSGQALFEYIALLFIGTLLVLGLVYQFNSALRKYFDAWFSGEGYLFCLIQNGYLPGEGGDVCSLPQFNLAAGQKVSGGIGGGSASGGKGANGANGKNGSGGGAGGAGNGGGGSGASGDGGGSKLVSANGRDFSHFGGAGGASGAGGKGAAGAAGAKGANTGNTGDSGFSSNGGGGGFDDLASGSGGRSPRTRLVPIQDDAGGGGGGGKATTTIPATKEDLQPARLVAADKVRRRQMQMDEVNTDFSFGKILKYVIILFIIFSIIFFVGSQLFAISRGGRKRR